jgi:hypothetical protein
MAAMYLNAGHRTDQGGGPGIKLALTGLTPLMTRLLQVSGLERRFPIMA